MQMRLDFVQLPRILSPCQQCGVMLDWQVLIPNEPSHLGWVPLDYPSQRGLAPDDGDDVV
jgi:hypothetical protein